MSRKSDTKKNQRIVVFARCRPINKLDEMQGSQSMVEIIPEQNKLVLKDKNSSRKEYFFDSVFPPDAEQDIKTDYSQEMRQLSGSLHLDQNQMNDVLLKYRGSMDSFCESLTNNLRVLSDVRLASLQVQAAGDCQLIDQSARDLASKIRRSCAVIQEKLEGILELTEMSSSQVPVISEVNDMLELLHEMEVTRYDNALNHLVSHISNLQGCIKKNKGAVNSLTEENERLRKEIETLQKDLVSARSSDGFFIDSENYTNLVTKVADLEKELEEVETGNSVLQLQLAEVDDLIGEVEDKQSVDFTHEDVIIALRNLSQEQSSSMVTDYSQEMKQLSGSLHLDQSQMNDVLIKYRRSMVSFRESLTNNLSALSDTLLALLQVQAAGDCQLIGQSARDLPYKSLTEEIERLRKENETLRKDLVSARSSDGFFIDSENYTNLVTKVADLEKELEEVKTENSVLDEVDDLIVNALRNQEQSSFVQDMVTDYSQEMRQLSGSLYLDQSQMNDVLIKYRRSMDSFRESLTNNLSALSDTLLALLQVQAAGDCQLIGQSARDLPYKLRQHMLYLLYQVTKYNRLVDVVTDMLASFSMNHEVAADSYISNFLDFLKCQVDELSNILRRCSVIQEKLEGILECDISVGGDEKENCEENAQPPKKLKKKKSVWFVDQPAIDIFTDIMFPFAICTYNHFSGFVNKCLYH